MKLKKWNGSAWVQDYPEVNVSSIVATGTPSSSTFLRGDGTWSVPAVNKADLKYLYMYGKAQSAITKGQAVQFAGVQGDHILMKPAVPSEINANPDYFMGIAETTLATNDFGYVLTQGELTGLNTNAYTEGAILWFASAGSTAGALTPTEPTNSNARIQVASVNKVNATEGILFVRVSFVGTEIEDIVASGTASSSTFLRGDGQWAVPAGVDNYMNTSGDTSSGMQIFYSSLGLTWDYANSPISIRERALGGLGDGEDRDAPNLNFHWGSRVSNSLWLGSNGVLNYGAYNSSGVPDAGGTIRAATFTGALSGNATTATTLQNARTINVGTGAAGTATSFNGSANITIPINSVSESYLSWGGQNTNGYVTPIGMSLSNEHSANRLAFINGNSLYFEYSSDGGSTWTDYGYSASTKSQFCTTSVGVPIGRTSGEYTTSSRTRITLTAQDGTNTYVYTNPRKMLLEVSSSGGMQVLVETRTGANYQSSGAWSTFGTYSISGWSGWNDIPLVLGTLGGGTTQTGNNWQLRLTFIMTSKNNDYPTTAQVNKLRIFGENNWFTPSTLANTNELYSYDMSQNALFPAIVQGTRFTSTVATGTSPLTVTSTTAVTNLNADLLDGNHSSAFATAVHSHNELSRRDSITYGLSALQWADISGTGGTGLNGAVINNPTNEWWHHLVMNHGNAAGYYVDIAAAFHTDDLYLRRNVGGTLSTWRKIWNEGNDGASSGLDADLLDGYHASSFVLGSSMINYALLASPTFTGTPTAPTATAGTNTTQIATTAFVSTAVANLINSAPGALDTLDELAAALGDDASFATTVTNSIATKLPLAGGTITNLTGTTSNSITFNTAQTFTGPYLRGQVQDLYRGYYTSQYKIWDEGNDGTGSTLDADLLDGNHASAFYLATNPSGYTSNTGTVTSVGGTGTVSGLTLTGTVTGSGNLTLGGTLSTSTSALSDIKANLTTQNANNIIISGFYHGDTNVPTTDGESDKSIWHNQYGGSSSWATQLATSWRNGRMWIRNKENGTWESWYEVFTENHLPLISEVSGLQTALDSKVDENAAITAGTATKITYDAKGLVTAGTTLSSGDLPSHTHTASQISDSGNVGRNLLTTSSATASTLFFKKNPDHTITLEDAATFRTSTGTAAASHTHAISDVTNLQTSLDGKAATSHSHAASDVTSGTFATARIPTLGNITNAGAIGSTANLGVVTTTSGVLTTRTLNDDATRGVLSSSSTDLTTERNIYWGTRFIHLGVTTVAGQNVSRTISFTTGMKNFILQLHQDTTTGAVIARLPLTITNDAGTSTDGQFYSLDTTTVTHRVAWSNGSASQIMNVSISYSGTTITVSHNFNFNAAFRLYGY